MFFKTSKIAGIGWYGSLNAQPMIFTCENTLSELGIQVWDHSTQGG